MGKNKGDDNFINEPKKVYFHYLQEAQLQLHRQADLVRSNDSKSLLFRRTIFMHLTAIGDSNTIFGRNSK